MNWPGGISPRTARMALIPALLAVLVPVFNTYLERRECEADSATVRFARSLPQERLARLYADAQNAGPVGTAHTRPEFADLHAVLVRDDYAHPGWLAFRLRSCGNITVDLQVTRRGDDGERIELVFGHRGTQQTEILWRRRPSISGSTSFAATPARIT